MTEKHLCNQVIISYYEITLVVNTMDCLIFFVLFFNVFCKVISFFLCE